MKNISTAVGAGMLAYGVLLMGFLSLWLIQGGVNAIIAQTPQAQEWQKCISREYPFEVAIYASTTTPYSKALNICGKSPYFSVIPN